MNYILFDDPQVRTNLLPLCYVRPIANIRVGILTIAEKWEYYLGRVPAIETAPYLQASFPSYWHPDNLLINSHICPSPPLLEAINGLEKGQALYKKETLVAARVSDQNAFKRLQEGEGNKIYFTDKIYSIQHVWDVFALNGLEIQADYELLTKDRSTEHISDLHTVIYNPDQVFIEPGARIKSAILDAEKGPIYIGKKAQVHPGSIITGPFALGEGAHINPGGRMRGDTTIGPYCKVGGEVSNSVFFGFSNKGHDGFLGNSVIGEWCNLGADSNTSNLKNNYGNVRVWNYGMRQFMDSGRQFVGLIMGDHSKCGINTMFNTGTVVGVGTNLFGAGFPPKFIPSFSWGGPDTGWTDYDLDKLFEVESRMMIRRNKELKENHMDLLTHLFEETAAYREGF